VKGWLLAAMLAGFTTLIPARGEENSRPEVVRIGMVGTLFRDTPEPLVLALMKPFGAMMEAQTGLTGKLIPGGDPLSLARSLAEDKVHLAVFHGFEFAWAQQQYPGFRPLMIAVNQTRHLQAYLVVRIDQRATALEGLKGKTLAMPRGTKEHCHLFLDRLCHDLGADPGQFFSRTTTPPNVEEALDDLVDGDVQAVVVDGVSLDCFKRRKPGRYARLKILLESPIFPAAVVAYHPGPLPEDVLNRFREGMINADKTPTGRQLMTLWKLTAFEAVPDDYEQTLAAIIKAYPPPK
jgi:ABC-type phosphate/phosphonate transport system substrate-binding protein